MISGLLLTQLPATTDVDSSGLPPSIEKTDDDFLTTALTTCGAIYVVEGQSGDQLCVLPVPSPPWGTLRELLLAVCMACNLPSREVRLIWAGQPIAHAGVDGTPVGALQNLLSCPQMPTLRLVRVAPHWHVLLERVWGVNAMETGEQRRVEEEELRKEALMRDSAFVLAAVQEDGCNLRLVSDEMRRNKAVVLAAVSENGRALGYVPPDLRTDKEVALAAMSENGSALEFATEEMRADPEIVGAAVRSSADGEALRLASEDCRLDRGLVLAAVRRSGAAIQHAHPILLRDRSFVCAAVRLNGTAFDHAPELMQHHPEVGAAAKAYWAGEGEEGRQAEHLREPLLHEAAKREEDEARKEAIADALRPRVSVAEAAKQEADEAEAATQEADEEAIADALRPRVSVASEEAIADALRPRVSVAD